MASCFKIRKKTITSKAIEVCLDSLLEIRNYMLGFFDKFQIPSTLFLTFGRCLHDFREHSVSELVCPDDLELVEGVGLEVEDLAEPSVGRVHRELDPVGVGGRGLLAIPETIDRYH